MDDTAGLQVQIEYWKAQYEEQQVTIELLRDQMGSATDEAEYYKEKYRKLTLDFAAMKTAIDRLADLTGEQAE